MIGQIKAWFRNWLLIPLCWLVGLLLPISIGFIVARAFPGAPWFVPSVCALPFVLSVLIVAEWFRRLVLRLLDQAS